MSLIKKSLQIAYFLLVIFLLSFIVFQWLSVFTSPIESSAPTPLKLGTTFGISPGDPELALYLAFFMAVGSIIPLIIGLLVYSRTKSKNKFLMWVSGLTIAFFFFIYFISGKVLSYFWASGWSDLFEAITALSLFLGFFLFIFIVLLYWFLIYISDKNKWVKIILIVVLIFFSYLSFALSYPVYGRLGDCREYTDALCLGRLAASKQDPLICNLAKVDEKFRSYEGKTFEAKRDFCLDRYIEKAQDYSPCLTRGRNPITDNGNIYLSPRSLCIINRYIMFYPCRKTSEACNIIENNKEREYCKKYQECGQISCVDSSDRIKEMHYRSFNEWDQCQAELQEIGIVHRKVD